MSITIWTDKEFLTRQIEVNIEFPSKIIELGFIYHLKAVDKIIEPKTIKMFYKILRTHHFKNKKRFPEGYIEKIISKIQEKCRLHYKNIRLQKFKFEEDEIQTIKLPHGFNSVQKDLLELLIADGWDKSFAKEAINYALTICKNKDNAVELHELVYSYKARNAQ